MKLSETLDACPICRGQIRGWATRSTRDGTFPIARCGTCGHAFANPRPDASALREFYAESGHGEAAEVLDVPALLERERRFPNSTVDASRMVSRLIAHGAKGALLDVGCGWGFFSKEAKSRGFDVTALELGRAERERAREIAGIEAIEAAFEDWEPGRRFDAIVLSQVLEHVLDVNLWMERARAALTPGGFMAIALPSFDSAFRLVLGVRDPYLTPPAHLNYFTHASLRTLVERHGFRVVETEDVTRLPANLLSRRLPVRDPRVVNLVEGATRLGARVFARGANRLGHGVMLNLYAKAP